MGMVVRTNMAGLNANNALNAASKTQQNAMQKLASGFRINKAADDASGLAISEKMKNQIKALDTAADNCEDGANMIQTAEGYMDEVHSMLNRMTELAEKAANGVLDDSDRDALQDEMDELCGEIDRIATTANFNGKKLMDGSIGGNASVTLVADEDTNTITYTKPDDTAQTKPDGHDNAKFIAAGDAVNNAGINLQIGESSTTADRMEVKINSFHTDTLFAGLDGFVNTIHDDTDIKNGATAAVPADPLDPMDPGTPATPAKTQVEITVGNKFSTYNNCVTINIKNQDNASAAADAIRQVSNYVSDERGKLGAQQNRLEHTVNNLTTASENITASNSRIRDTNMAEEMMSYTSKNVIAQAAQAMLAQANSQPQNVLSLLQ